MRLEVTVLVGQRHSLGHLELLFVLANLINVQVNFRGRKGRGLDKGRLGITDELAGEPEEGLFKVVVGLGRDVIVLQVLLAVKCNSLCLHLSVLHIHLVSHQNNGDILTDTHEIAMPVGHRLVGEARGHVEHDDRTLSLNVVTVTETTKLLLTSGIPHVENDLTSVGHEVKGVHLQDETKKEREEREKRVGECESTKRFSEKESE